MAKSKKNFTFIWKLKNFSFCLDEILSPSFSVFKKIGGTKFEILLNPNSVRYGGCAACYLRRDNDDYGPESFELDYELSFLDGDGFAIQSKIFLKQVYKKGDIHLNTALHAKRDEVCLRKKDLFIPGDILTICCRMWDNQKFITLSRRCLTETCIETESRTFVGIIKKFSSILPSCKNLVCTQSSSTETFLSSMNLTIGTDGKIVIEMNLFNHQSSCMYKYEIFIRDVFGNKAKSGHGEFYDNGSHNIPLTLLKEYLMENKRDYLPNDMLIIECEVTFSTGKKLEKIDEPGIGFDFLDAQEIISNAVKKNLSLKESLSESFTTLKDDFSSLFKDNALCDTKLITATEAFPAHIAVLSARSPVFKSMFTSGMKEKTSKRVDINDLDADTVRRMLLFMYSDTLNDLNYNSAKNLYFAADKYNIVSLRHRCSIFLKQNLLRSNFYETLLLAVKHQDRDLKNAVQDYIIRNYKTVLFSEEWKNLEKNNSQLTTELLRTMYIKSRRI